MRLENVDSSGNQGHFEAANVSDVADPSGSKEPDYGGGILLRNVVGATLAGVQAHSQWNGVTLSGASKVVLDKCDLSKNEDTGLHLWNSHDNEIRDCRVAFVGVGIGRQNAFAMKPGDQAGILIEHDSSRNRFLRNTIVHCAGDGVLIRANEFAATPAADAVKLGLPKGDLPVLLPTHPSNDNVFDGNDASFAEMGSSFEAPRSSGNQFLHNVAAFSGFGFDLEFSRKALVKENLIVGNRSAGVRCDNGWSNAFDSNTFVKDLGSPVALSFAELPATVAGTLNRSGDVQIFGNTFVGYGRPLRLIRSWPTTIQTNRFVGTDSAEIADIAQVEGRAPLAPNNDPAKLPEPFVLLSAGNGAILPSLEASLGGVSVSHFAPKATEGIVQGSLTGRFEGEEYEIGRVTDALSEAYFPNRCAPYVRVVGADSKLAAFIAHLGDSSLALHHAADASSNTDGAYLAVDGDWCTPGKAWSPSDQDGQWWEVDLNRTSSLTGFAISAGDVDPNAFWSKFHIVVSRTGNFLGEEQTVVTETDFFHHPGPIRQYRFPPVDARFVKIIADVAQKGVQLQEFGVYGTVE